MPLRQRLRDLTSRPSRELFVYLVRKEIKVKYKNSFLGFLWSMLNPALTLAVFYVLFTYFLPNGIPNFVIYMFSATLVWNLFLTGVMGATSTVVANGGIVKKVAFPREILPLASVGSALVFFFFQGIVMVAFMFAFWHRPDWGLIWLLVPAMAGAADVLRGAERIPVRRERVSPRHPAPRRGTADGVVLGDPGGLPRSPRRCTTSSRYTASSTSPAPTFCGSISRIRWCRS